MRFDSLKKSQSNIPNFRAVQEARAAEEARAAVAVESNATFPAENESSVPAANSEVASVIEEAISVTNESQNKDATVTAQKEKSSPAPSAKQTNAGRKRWGAINAIPQSPKGADAPCTVNVKMSAESHRALVYAKAYRKDLTANNMLHWGMTDTLNRTYICHNPNCGHAFTLRTTSLITDTPSPQFCPICGGKEILPVKFCD